MSAHLLAPVLGQQTQQDHSAIIVAIIMAGLGLLGTIVGGWYTFRAARSNAESTREVERNKIDAASWEGWREDVETLRRQRKEDTEEYLNHRRDCAEQISKLNDRVETVVAEQERAREADRRKRAELEHRIDALTDWGRQVVVIMEAQGISFPTPPPGMMPSDPNGRPQGNAGFED
jgi:uncharacterized membrane protein